MATVHFYEKPGCINNTRQKRLLVAAGHRVVALNLLEEAWTPERLRPFFSGRPVAEWFNRSAPAVKSGEVVPESLTEAQALALMVKRPLLIRRPLMQVEDSFEVGFDQDRVDEWIGLAARTDGDVEACPRSAPHQAAGGGP